MIRKEITIDIIKPNCQVLQLEKGNKGYQLHIYFKKNNENWDIVGDLELILYNSTTKTVYPVIIGNNSNEAIVNLDENNVGLYNCAVCIKNQYTLNTLPFLIEIYDTPIIDKSNLPLKAINVEYINGKYYVVSYMFLGTREHLYLKTRNGNYIGICKRSTEII